MKWVFPLLFCMSLCTTAFAQEFNAGFVEGLWFDSDKIFVRDTARIYVAVRNNTGADLTGTIEFFDGDKKLERVNIRALDGRIIESWADWVPKFGEHKISATLSRIELHSVGSTTKEIEVVSALAERTIFVDYDTDKDGEGNETDTDDDGDGTSDEHEEINGTDPLDADDPPPEEESNDDRADGGGQEDSNDENTTVNRSSNGPVGLEQYLTDSRANQAFSSITDVVNNTRSQLDAYRERRNAVNATDRSETVVADESENMQSDSSATSSNSEEESSESSASSSTSTTDTTNVNGDGFGEIERTKAEKGPGFLTTLTNLIKTLLINLVTLSLFLASLYLSHPILVQVTLLLLILFLVYKLAKRIGARNRD